MATSRQELEDLLIKADSAGDTESATVLTRRLDEFESTEEPRGSLTDVVMSGATFGLTDEVAGLARGVVAKGAELFGGQDSDFGQEYEAGKASAQADQAAYLKRHPVLGPTAEIAGGLASVAPAKVGAAGVGAVNAAIEKLPGWMKSLGLGGLFGGAHGAGTSDGGIENRLKGAATGMLLGAGTGTVLHPLIAGGTAAVRGTKRAFQSRYGNVHDAAIGKMAEKVDDVGLTGGRLETRLKNMGDDAVLADVGGDELLGMGAKAIRTPGPARTQAQQMLDRRARQEGTQIAGSVQKGLQPDDFYTAEEAFINDLKNNATPLYEEAMKFGDLESPKLMELMSRQISKKGLNEAQRIATDIQGKPIEIPPEGRVTTELVDHVKKGLDVLIDAQQSPNFRGLTYRGKEINKVRKELLAEVDLLNPSYAKARRQWDGDREIVQALKDGRGVLKIDPEVIRRELADIHSVAGKEAYRSGAARAIKDIVDNVKDTGSAATRLFDKQRNRDRFREIFPDINTFNVFKRTMIQQMRFAKTRGRAQGGSSTEPQFAEKSSLEKPVGAIGTLSGGFIPVGHALMRARIAREAALGLLGKPPRLEGEIGKMLFSRDPAQNARTIQEITSRLGSGKATNNQINLLRSVLTRALAQEEGQWMGSLMSDQGAGP